MPTVNELIAIYEGKTNSELLELYKQFDNYSDDAKKAFFIVIEKRGGLDVLKKEYETQTEMVRILPMIKIHVRRMTSHDNLMSDIGSTMLSPSQIQEIIDRENGELESTKEEST